MGVALSACTLPPTGRPNSDLPEGEMEIGMGIHGEPRRGRRPPGAIRMGPTRRGRDRRKRGDAVSAPALRPT
ncbi:dihydroxyacetone kinase subunit DhaK [Histidinibacterium lentulum]|uniref:DhaK domain-containing protein n=1 Tax=Histidinibacterium lentulum TaxID=2480588 RepID=A0A3N2R7S0_9RHOB|nr:dihydroxyacetone kinase subunit DhaK [Histidinibacterium lentulum]ROU03458.1 hypothetical protein EAT49_03950 [Histidinibacterium lentulum]